MRYCQAKAQHFRLFKQFCFEPHPKLTVVTGDNAAGKTSLLEALYVAARGESHRSATANLAFEGQTSFRVEALVDPGAGRLRDRIDVMWQERRIAVRVNDQAISIADLVRSMPVLMLDPYAHRLVEDGPGVRRKFIDWGAFHMEPAFHPVWRRFHRALKQRNSAIRSGASTREVESWTSELVSTADLLTRYRQAWLERMIALVPTFWFRLVDDRCWSLEFARGWRPGEDYAETLARSLEGDRKAGHTREGPHRAELLIFGDNSSLKERISRGQQKLLIAGLLLAQAELYRLQHDDTPVLLIDDFSAELSADSQRRFLTELAAWPGQSIVTALDYSPILAAAADHAVFHVEHREITLKKTT